MLLEENEHPLSRHIPQVGITRFPSCGRLSSQTPDQALLLIGDSQNDLGFSDCQFHLDPTRCSPSKFQDLILSQ